MIITELQVNDDLLDKTPLCNRDLLIYTHSGAVEHDM